jgi:cyclic 2,3-diphosphoglycerate synthase
VRAVAVIDGEHYAPVVRDALAELPYDFAAAYLAGGTEKLRGDDDYGVPVLTDLEAALAEYEPGVVVDLSDEPVLGPRERFRLASRVLARGLSYVGPDFSLNPPPLDPFPLPSLAVIGTGKRMGKTAVAGYVARLLAEERDVVVVSMGRGGPPNPELAEVRPRIEDLLELSRGGQHAASDYLETAALSGVVTIGCRRCGGGLAGATAISNVAAGAELAAARGPELVIFDGSGAAIPPVATAKRILVAGAHQPSEIVAGYLNAYRILVSDLVLLTMAEEGSPHEELRAAIGEVNPEVQVVACVLRPRPISPVAGRRVAFFTTAPEEAHDVLAAHLRSEHSADVIGVSGNLARRDQLRTDIDRLEADVYLVEIKAAAIDVVAEESSRRGVELVFADNDLLPLAGEPDLDEELWRLVA